MNRKLSTYIFWLQFVKEQKIIYGCSPVLMRLISSEQWNMRLGGLPFVFFHSNEPESILVFLSVQTTYVVTLAFIEGMN